MFDQESGQDAAAPTSGSALGEGHEMAVDPFTYIQQAEQGLDPFAEANPEETADEAQTLGQQPGQPVLTGPAAEAEAKRREWQSNYDRLQREFENYKSQAEQLNPLMGVVNETPELAHEVLSMIERARKGEQAAPEPEPQPPVAPQPPEAPAAYSEYEAFSDPQSESWRYRKSLEKHQGEVQRHQLELQQFHFDAKLKQMQAQFQPYQQAVEQQMQQQQRQQQLNQLASSISQRFQMDPAEALAAAQWGAAYQPTEEDLVMLYRAHQGQGQQPLSNGLPPRPTAQADARARALAAKKQIDFPLPAARAGAQQQSAGGTASDLFDEMLAMDNAMNPFAT